MKINFLALAPYFTQDPSKPRIVKDVVLRYMLKLNNVPRELINVMTYNPDEEDAKAKVALLNMNDMD